MTEYIRFIRREFDNPAGIWEHPFRYDISSVARSILIILWTFGGTAELESLKSAVNRLSITRDEGEFALQFEDGLRQLDGNFISTDRYTGRAKKGEYFLVAQFSNASVEEFIDKFLRSDASWIERLIKSVVCFRQVRELVTQTLGRLRLHKQLASYWMSLRDTSASTENVPGGSLINLQLSAGWMRRVWDLGDADWSRQTHVRLQIESEVNLQDALFAKLQERVLTPDGWLSIVRGIQNNDTHAYGVKILHEWIMKKSGWPNVIKATCHSAFCRAVSLLLNDEDDIWACSIGSLQILAKIISTNGVPLTDHEKAGFLAGGKLAAGIIIEKRITQMMFAVRPVSLRPSQKSVALNSTMKFQTSRHVQTISRNSQITTIHSTPNRSTSRNRHMKGYSTYTPLLLGCSIDEWKKI